MIPTFSRRNRSISAKSRCVSRSVREAVGSSRISSRTLFKQRLGNLDHLLMGAGEIAHGLPRIKIEAKFGQHKLRAIVHALHAQEAKTRDLRGPAKDSAPR